MSTTTLPVPEVIELSAEVALVAEQFGVREELC